MKRQLWLAALCLIPLGMMGQTPDYNISINQETFSPSANKSKAISERKQLAAADISKQGAFQYYLVQFHELPDAAEKKKLAAKGIDLLYYIPNNAYIASVSANASLATLNTKNVRAIIDYEPRFKIAPTLTQHIQGLASTDKVKVSLTCFNKTKESKSLLSQQVKALSAESTDDALVVECTVGELDKLASLVFVEYIDLFHKIELEAVWEGWHINGSARENTINNGLSTPLINGSGVRLWNREGGSIEVNNLDLKGRALFMPTGELSGHKNNTSECMGDAGNTDPMSRFFAWGADILLNDNSSNQSNYYNTQGMRYANSSYGSGWASSYNSEARSEDMFTYNNPFYSRVFSAGNSGGTAGSYAPYTGIANYANITGGMKTGKNLFTIGSVDRNDNLIGFSSRGPIYDGRVKPELVIHGEGGTSYAAPRLTGTLALLNQAYRLNNSNAEPPSQLLKAVLINTADDVGTPGVDYQTGYGKVNVRRAYNTIKDKRIVTASINNGGNNTHQIAVPANTHQLRVSIVWADYPGAVNAAVSLVNNLNMTVAAPSGTVVSPWVLNNAPSGIASQATRGTDNLNNMEQVTIDNPAAGNYGIRVNGAAVPFGPQTYFVTYEFLTNEIMMTYPMGGESFVPGETQIIRWDYYGSDNAAFTLQYSTNNGTSWNNISTSVASNRRYYQWAVPNITGPVQVRVSKGALSDVTNSPVSFIGRPTPTIQSACNNTVVLQWPAVSGATGYDVYVLGAKYMELVGSSTTTSFTVPNINSTGTFHFSVSAKGANGLVGRRSNALQKNPGDINCNSTPNRATLYKHCNYDPTGYAISLPTGSYNTAQMTSLGISNNDISSLTVTAGFEVVLYDQDNFTGTYQIIRADLTCLTVRNINDWASSMIIRAATPNQLPAVSITSPANNASFAAPAGITINANASDADGIITQVAFYNGSNLLGTDNASPYTFSWAGVAAGTYSITARATDIEGGITTSTVVSVTVTNPANQLPVVNLTSPTILTYTAPASISIAANASDADGSITQVAFYNGTNLLGTDNTTPYTYSWTGVVAGTYSITARATDNAGAVVTSSAVSVTVTNPANQLPVVNLTSPTILSYTAPANISIAANASDADGSITQVAFYNGTNLLGTDNTTPYTYSWTGVAAGSYSITARATDNAGAVVTSAAVSVTVTNPANQLPVVSLTSPANGSSYTAPASISIAANASDADGSITQVAFYNGTNLLGTDNTTPYTYSWTGVVAGSYSITARATDNAGAVVTSAAVSVTVTNPVNQLPVVSLTSPTILTYTAPASISIAANASDADGSITQVAFYNGTNLLGTDNTTPYTYSWTGVAAGTYSITARATDNAGAVVTSAAVSVTVTNPANQLPVVSLTSPASGSSYTAPASISIAANASDADGSITQVAFYNGTNLLGTDNTMPYTYSWTGVAAGTYSITARATDNAGAVVTSAASSVTVTAVTDQCAALAQYVENSGYVAGSKVKNEGARYECKPWPYSGWCNGAAWAYAPGTGMYWQDAWTSLGSCAARIGNESLTTNGMQIGNVPNPFSDETNIELNVATAGHVYVVVYDKTGQRIRVVNDGYLSEGMHQFTFNATQLTAGMYIVQVKSETGVISQKMIKME